MGHLLLIRIKERNSNCWKQSIQKQQELSQVHIDKLFVEMGGESLQSRRSKHKLVLFYKILHGLAPDYLYDLLPPLVQETTTYNLRNSVNIQKL